MRVVIDGLPIRNDDNLSRIVARLLQVWTQPQGTDELHLVVGAVPQIAIPEWVVVHQVRSDRRGAIGRLYARVIGVPRLCRSLKAHVLLGLQPPKALATMSCPRRTVIYDLWHQPGSEQFTGTALVQPDAGIAWTRFANRLRLSMIDAVAVKDWHARRFKLTPLLLWTRQPETAKRRTLAESLPRLRLPVAPRRSLRWIAAVSASTLALSAAAAASVDLVVSHNLPVSTPHHDITTPSVTHSSGGGRTNGGSSVPSGVVPLPAPTATSTTSPSAPEPNSSLAPSASSTTAAGSTKPTTGISIPGLTLPTVTLPSIPTPSLPLPVVTCTSNPTTTSSPLSLLNLCNVTVGGLSLGSK